MNLPTRNNCPVDCPCYDSESGWDSWYQWCRHDDYDEDKEVCPLTGEPVEEG